MPNLTNVKVDSLFCMFKGEPGTRKSTQALSFPKPIYYVDVDNKMESLIKPANAWKVNPAEIEFDTFTVDKNGAFEGIMKKLEAFQLNCKFKTIVIDSITSIGDLINLKTMELKSGTTTKSGSEAGMRVGGITVNTFEDYKAENSGFMQLVSVLKDIKSFNGTNIILIAHVIGTRSEKETGGLTHFARTIITGGKAISGKLPAYCSEVYHFNVISAMDVSKPGKYGLFTEHTGDDFARTSLPLDKFVEFGDKPLYETFLIPAINKLQEKK